jgi:hypothetical protein
MRVTLRRPARQVFPARREQPFQAFLRERPWILAQLQKSLAPTLSPPLEPGT